LNAPNKTDNETDFFLNKGLDGSPGVPTTMGLLFAWFLVWAVMVGGVSGSGKIAYFTALFPYFVLLILLIFGCQLENAGEGIKYFFNPDFEHLLSGKVRSEIRKYVQFDFKLIIIISLNFTFRRGSKQLGSVSSRWGLPSEDALRLLRTTPSTTRWAETSSSSALWIPSPLCLLAPVFSLLSATLQTGKRKKHKGKTRHWIS
jgi:hypothetical protein